MSSPRRRIGRIGRVAFVALMLSVATASAQPESTSPNDHAAAVAPKPKTQGVAVLGAGASRDQAFGLARAVYASSLRPRGLDELRARILAGDPAPPTASKDVRELAELRAGVTGEDAASRQLLSTIAQRLDVQGLLVVTARKPAPSPQTTDPDAAPPSSSGEEAASAADAGAPPSVVTARLFLPETNEFDAARYEADTSGATPDWRGTVTSLTARFPAPATVPTAQLQGPPPKLTPGKEDKHFYTSPWLWGALGAAALVGGFFFFASQDTSNDPIHLQMRVPR